MSLLETLRTNAGTGNAKIGLHILKAKVRQGDMVSGQVYVIGGEAEQKIDGVTISVMTTILVNEGERKVMQDAEIQHFSLTDSFRILPKEEKTVPFSLKLSPETPQTIHKVDVWLKTVLKTEKGKEASDEHDIHVMGTEAAEKILAAMHELDFSLKKALNIKSDLTHSGVVQELEFYPSHKFKRHFTILQLALISDNVGTTAYIKLVHEGGNQRNSLGHKAQETESKTLLHYRYGNVPDGEEVYQQLLHHLTSKT
ncbi:sporulation protein [Planococcus liqunii]|uniref:sporulation protein n=1 Tax=Planococcus liqunii TaxID=3058394 RepID=UPI0026247A27|nr:sporulation protein [Planococcus sp. N056]WKA52733.1 sporulation protein [Planococcus sp. N056]